MDRALVRDGAFMGGIMPDTAKIKTKPIRILTFDIEEWFHILDTTISRSETCWGNYESRIHANMERILDLLGRHNQRATFFCLGWIARKYPDIIRAIADKGFEIGSHSSLHQLVYELGPDAFKRDVADSVNALQECIGKKITLFRAPGFSIGKKRRGPSKFSRHAEWKPTAPFSPPLTVTADSRNTAMPGHQSFPSMA